MCPASHPGSGARIYRWLSHKAWGSAALVVALCNPAIVLLQIPQAPMPRPSSAHVTLQDAQKLIDAGKFNQADAELRLFLGTEQHSAAAHTMLAYSLLRLNKPKDSLAEYTQAAAIEPPTAVDLQNVAKDYVLLDDLVDAEHWMLIAVRDNERDPEAWYGLGRIRYSLQRFQEAADCFQQALVLAPRNVKAENNLGLAFEGLNRTDDAVAAYRLAIEWQQKEEHPSAQPLLNLGIILVHQGKLQEAEALLSKAVAIEPRDPGIREQLGHLYLQLNLLQESQQQFEEAISLKPENPSLHFMLGKVYHQEGLEQKAKAEFARSAELSGYHSSPETN